MNFFCVLLILLFMAHPVLFWVLVLVFVLFLLYFISEALFWTILIILIVGILCTVYNGNK